MKLLREYFELCDGGVCQDLLTEDEKRRVANGATILTGVMQMSETKMLMGECILMPCWKERDMGN